METLFIVMPAYNEATNIDIVVNQWYPVIERIGGQSRLVIVDDGSKDDTYLKLKQLAKVYPSLVPITKNNSGHGATCLFTYQYSIDNNATYIFQTDSDGQTDPDDFWKFWQNRSKYDFIIGDRFNRQDGWSRIWVAKILKLVIYTIFGITVKDANTPFRLMKAENLRSVLQFIPPEFFLSNVLISILIVLKGERFQWFPIQFKSRQSGVNSINLKKIIIIGIQAITEFIHIKHIYKYKKVDALMETQLKPTH